MFKSPKKVLHKKTHKLYVTGVETRASLMTQGTFGIKATEAGYLTARQIEAVRRVIRKALKKNGNIFIKVFPYLSLTSKPLATRMGKGKGNPFLWVAPVKAGRMLFEISGVSPRLARKALALATMKLPILCKLIMHNIIDVN